jgi:hypothetical protein
VRRRDDVTRRHELEQFLGWLLGKHSQREAAKGSARTLRRRTAWCWDVQPKLGPVESAHHQVLIDGVWIGTWCLLIAVTEQLQVLAWQWCARESIPAWEALFRQIPAPQVVVCDGGTGIAAAVRTIWPGTRIQRCLFHVQLNVRQHLTLKPRTDAGRRLLALSRMLSQVRTIEDAIGWQQHLDAWWQAHGHLTRERTYFRNGQWGFTHERLRKAWLLLRKLARSGTLFTYLEHDCARTTSPLEGGINSQIKNVLRDHRGMSEEHMKRAAEWFLTLHEIPISDAHQLIAKPPASEPDDSNDTDDLDLPALYDTALSADDGLWLRSGWAGHS